MNSQLTHEKDQAIRNKSTLAPEKRSEQPHDLYPPSFPHFIRVRDSLWTYITKLFTT
jgi:hypothetical protein